MTHLKSRLIDIATIYWELARIIVPIAIVAEILIVTGVVDFIAPAFEPLMTLIGLPPELALAAVVGILVGLWNAIILLFLLVPVSELTTADITVFSALMLVAHALPMEQQIIKRAGPSFTLTFLLRLIGGFIFAWILHLIFSTTGWLSEPAAPVLIPVDESEGWINFFWGLAETMVIILLILALLIFAIDALKAIGVMDLLNKLIAPILRLVGIKGEAVNLTAVGLFLGIGYGGGLLIREARSGSISQHQVLLSCVFMGFAHSIVEDTLLFVAIGADLISILVGRVLFAIVATAAFAFLLRVYSTERPRI